MNFLRRCVRFPSCLLNNVKYMGTKLYEPEYLEVNLFCHFEVRIVKLLFHSQ